jgi:hypothetical protein
MHDGRRPDVEPDQTQAPWDALSKVQIVAVMHGRFCDQLARPRLLLPTKLAGQTTVAGFAWWILNSAARTAHLELESAKCGCRGQPERGARSRTGRQQRLRRASNRVPGFTFLERRDHQASARLKMAAPEHNPRS